MKEHIPKTFPDAPGVYLMKNREGDILYVGKAKNLKKRVQTYFQRSRTQSPYTKKLVEQIDNIEYIETETEIEALILESNLIKEYRPKYNIVLRDDKSFLYIKITTNEDFPRISLVRHADMKQDKNAKYYGPKTSAEKTRKTLKLLKKLFPHRHCGLNIDWLGEGNVMVTNKVLKYPCIDYHIKRCQAPCIGAITPEEYRKTVKKITGFLEGKYSDIVKELKEEMQQAVGGKQFEKAAVIRDKIAAIENSTARQRITDTDGRSRDVINFITDGRRIFFNLFIIREGQLIDQENFIFGAEEEQNAEAIIAAFIREYYKNTANLPREILIPNEPEDKNLLLKWLGAKIIVPKIGKKEKLLQLGLKNAHSFARQSRARWEKDRELQDEFESLKKLLKVTKPIRRIEAYDISHLGGTHTTGSMVVFENGKPKKSDYRHFRLRGTAEKNDDYQSMTEILTRRLARMGGEGTQQEKQQSGSADKNEYEFTREIRPRTTESFAKTPDLIIIDGGKGQLKAGTDVRKKLKLDIPMVAIAKKHEEIFLPGQSAPLAIPRDSEISKLFQHIRDEAHRFALNYNKLLRKKNLLEKT